MIAGAASSGVAPKIQILSNVLVVSASAQSVSITEPMDVVAENPDFGEIADALGDANVEMGEQSLVDEAMDYVEDFVVGQEVVVAEVAATNVDVDVAAADAAAADVAAVNVASPSCAFQPESLRMALRNMDQNADAQRAIRISENMDRLQRRIRSSAMGLAEDVEVPYSPGERLFCGIY